jgi:hypothetical protein
LGTSRERRRTLKSPADPNVLRRQGLCVKSEKNGYNLTRCSTKVTAVLKGKEGANPIDATEPELEAPRPESANYKLDQQVPNTKNKVTFSDVVVIIPRQSLTKSASKLDLDRFPEVETVHEDLGMTSKTHFGQADETKVVSTNDTTAPPPGVSMQ